MDDKTQAERFNLDLVLSIAEETIKHGGTLNEEAGIVTIRFADGSYVDFTRPMAWPVDPDHVRLDPELSAGYGDSKER